MSTPKGETRREAILVAAADLVARQGPASVSHRAVAAAAGVPLAATTYYFRDLADLLVAAVDRAGTDELDRAAAILAAVPKGRRTIPDVAALVADVLVGADRHTDAELRAYYERWLAGGRHPELQPVLQAARARLAELVAEVLHRGDTRVLPADRVIALADGAALSALVQGDGRAREAVEAAVAELLSRRRRW